MYLSPVVAVLPAGMFIVEATAVVRALSSGAAATFDAQQLHPSQTEELAWDSSQSLVALHQLGS